MAGEKLPVFAHLGMKGLGKMTICFGLMRRKLSVGAYLVRAGEEGDLGASALERLWANPGKWPKTRRNSRMSSSFQHRCQWWDREGRFAFLSLEIDRKSHFMSPAKHSDSWTPGKLSNANWTGWAFSFLLVSYAPLPLPPPWRRIHWESIPSFCLIVQKRKFQIIANQVESNSEYEWLKDSRG